MLVEIGGSSTGTFSSWASSSGRICGVGPLRRWASNRAAACEWRRSSARVGTTVVAKREGEGGAGAEVRRANKASPFRDPFDSSLRRVAEIHQQDGITPDTTKFRGAAQFG